MKSHISLVVLLVVVAGVDLQVEGRGLMDVFKRLGNEWQWIDSFVKGDASCDKLNKHLDENQAKMGPKMLAAFKLVADAACMNPPVTGCSESEAMQIVRLFNALHIDIEVETNRYAQGVDKLAFDTRDNYIEFCSRSYSNAISLSLSESMNNDVRNRVQDFAAEYGEIHRLSEKKTFKPFMVGKLTSKGCIANGLMGKSIFASLRYKTSRPEKQLSPVTGKQEYNFLEIVNNIKADCKTYVDVVKGPLESIAKDEIVARTLPLSRHSWQIWRSWTATIFCAQLDLLEAEKVAMRLGIEAANSGVF